MPTPFLSPCLHSYVFTVARLRRPLRVQLRKQVRLRQFIAGLKNVPEQERITVVLLVQRRLRVCC